MRHLAAALVFIAACVLIWWMFTKDMDFITFIVAAFIGSWASYHVRMILRSKTDD